MQKTATKDEAVAFYQQIAALAAAFGVAADEPTLMAYRIGLEDVPPSTLKRIIAQAIRSGGEFMPKVGTLRKMAGMEVGPEGRAMIAFDALGEAVSANGAYRTVRFTDPFLNQAVQSLGGWVRICETTSDDWDTHFRRNFLATYKENFEMKRGTMYAQLGIAEVANNAASLPSPPPVLISVQLPKVPGVGYEIPEKRQHLLRTDAKQLAHDIGRIDT